MEASLAAAATDTPPCPRAPSTELAPPSGHRLMRARLSGATARFLLGGAADLLRDRAPALRPAEGGQGVPPVDAGDADSRDGHSDL